MKFLDSWSFNYSYNQQWFDAHLVWNRNFDDAALNCGNTIANVPIITVYCRAIAWWRHQMETFSALLAICGGIQRSPVISPHKGQWRGALMFSLVCVWINGWVNNREAGNLIRYRAHYDVSVMRLIRSSEDGRDFWILQVSSEKNKPNSFFFGSFCRAGFILRNKNMFTISTICQHRGGTGGWSLNAWKRHGPSYPA